ncbi:MAG: hypothetical protein HY000_24110 [Planctomycetes bacterium]|nr:hypothetical protein [Planctomycetota bacterium]
MGELSKELTSIVAILIVVLLVSVPPFVQTFDKTEIGTLLAVAMCLAFYEAGRHVDRINRHRAERRRNAPWLSIGRGRILVALLSTTLLFVLYSRHFDYDELARIAALVFIFGGWEGFRAARYWYESLTPEERAGLGSCWKVLREAVLKAVGTVFGTAIGGAVIAACAYFAKPLIDSLKN